MESNSVSKMDCVKCLLEENEDRTKDYLNKRTREAKRNFTIMPYAYNQHPDLQNRLLLYYIIHEFLETLNLTQTLLIFNKETAFRATDYNEYVPMFGMEWLMKSFLMHDGYHGVLPAILHNFEGAYQRVLAKKEANCNMERLLRLVEGKQHCSRLGKNHGTNKSVPAISSCSLAADNISLSRNTMSMNEATAPPMDEVLNQITTTRGSCGSGRPARKASFSLSRNTTDLNEATTAIIEDLTMTPATCAKPITHVQPSCSMSNSKTSCPQKDVNASYKPSCSTCPPPTRHQLSKASCCPKQAPVVPAEDIYSVTAHTSTKHTHGHVDITPGCPINPPSTAACPAETSGWARVKSCLKKFPPMAANKTDTFFTPDRYSTPDIACSLNQSKSASSARVPYKTIEHTPTPFTPDRYSTPDIPGALNQSKCAPCSSVKPSNGGSPGCRPVNQSVAGGSSGGSGSGCPLRSPHKSSPSSSSCPVKTCPPPVIGPNECAITDSQPCCPPVPSAVNKGICNIPTTIHGHVDNTPGSPLTADQLSAAAMGEPIEGEIEEEAACPLSCGSSTPSSTAQAAALTKENVTIHQYLEGVDNSKGSNFHKDFVKSWQPTLTPLEEEEDHIVVESATTVKEPSVVEVPQIANWPRAVKKVLMKHKAIAAWVFPDEADRILKDARKCGHANGPACGCVRGIDDGEEEFEAPVCYRGPKTAAQVEEERIQKGLSRVCTDLRDYRGVRRTEVCPKTGKRTLYKHT